GLPAVDEFAVFAHRFDREAHFFFFFFFLMISAWVLTACASALIWLAAYVSAVFTATRSAMAACCRIALTIFIGGQLLYLCVVPAAARSRRFAAACSDFRCRPANVPVAHPISDLCNGNIRPHSRIRCRSSRDGEADLRHSSRCSSELGVRDHGL